MSEFILYDRYINTKKGRKMLKTKIKYEDAARHFHKGRTVLLYMNENLSFTFSPKKTTEEYLEDISVMGSTTDKINGQWFLIKN